MGKLLERKRFAHTLETIRNEVYPLRLGGSVASYIPELATVSPDLFSAACAECGGAALAIGDARVPFSLQSIAKTLLLAFALEKIGMEEMDEIVDSEPSSEPFNSIVKLETERRNRPLNPFVNAGAIAVCSLIAKHYSRHAVAAVRDFACRLVGGEGIEVNERVRDSESATASRNRALAYFMESTGILRADVESSLAIYFSACGFEATAPVLARLGAVIAAGGTFGGRALLSRETCYTLLGLMATCGLYNGSGDFAVRVGLPAKSGVGGGILAIVPGRMGVAVFSPPLDAKGNSVAGVAFMERLSKEFALRGF